MSFPPRRGPCPCPCPWARRYASSPFAKRRRRNDWQDARWEKRNKKEKTKDGRKEGRKEGTKLHALDLELMMPHRCGTTWSWPSWQYRRVIVHCAHTLGKTKKKNTRDGQTREKKSKTRSDLTHCQKEKRSERGLWPIKCPESILKQLRRDRPAWHASK